MLGKADISFLFACFVFVETSEKACLQVITKLSYFKIC